VRDVPSQRDARRRSSVTPPNTPRRPTRPRIQTPTSRELASEQARRERASSIDEAAAGVVGPYEDEEEDLTGQYEGEELERLRRERRTTDQAVAHLERRMDKQVTAFGEFQTEITGKVEHMSGVMEGLGGEIRRTLDTLNQRDHMTFTAKVDVDTTKQKAEIETQAETATAKAVAEAKAEAAIEVAKAKAELERQATIEKDRIARLDARRKAIYRVVAGVGLIVLGMVVHGIAQHFGWSLSP
jgi:hypothetical protein